VPIILATQEDLCSKPAWTNGSSDPYLEKKKTITKKGLVEWLKVYALSSSPSTEKKEREI
jgi:hypothetical protein